MSTIAKGVALNFGLITASVSVKSAQEPAKKTGNVRVCDTGHEPKQIRQPLTCEVCGPIAAQQAKTARPVEGGYVLLEAADRELLKQQAEKVKRNAAITVHPREEVDLQTATGGRVYYLVPEPGLEQAYALLHALVAGHPELAFVTKWAPRTTVSLYQLEALNDVLLFQQREEAARLKAAPEVKAQAAPELLSLAEKVLKAKGTVTKFDPDSLRDDSEEQFNELVAGRAVVQLADKTTTVVAPATNGGGDLAEALAAMLKQNTPKKAPTKKAPTKKEAK